MRYVKIIPCLDIKRGGVFNGIKFVNLKDARDPAEAAQENRGLILFSL
jgi:cyclase